MQPALLVESQLQQDGHAAIRDLAEPHIKSAGCSEAHITTLEGRRNASLPTLSYLSAIGPKHECQV